MVQPAKGKVPKSFRGTKKTPKSVPKKKSAHKEKKVQFGSRSGHVPPKGGNVGRALAQEREARREDLRNISLSFASQTINEQTVNICIQVNPYIVAQYLWGMLGKCLAQSGRDRDLNSMIGYFWYAMSNFEDTETLFWTNAPRAWVQLRKALEPRRVGRYYYSADFTQIRHNAGLIATSNPAIQESYWGFSINMLSGNPDSNGFAQPTTTPSALQSDFYSFIAQFSSTLDLCAYDAVAEDYSDASAFSFPVDHYGTTAAVTSSDPNRVCFKVGLAGGGTNYAILNQVGACGLEVQPRRRWLAALVLAAEPSVAGPGTTSEPNTRTLRCPRFTVLRYGTPSAAGWNSSRVGRIDGPVQLKPVPTFRLLQNMVSKIEAAGALAGSGFTTPIAASDVKLWALMALRRYASRYSGAYAGAVLISGTTTTQNYPMVPEYHCGMSDIASLKVPEPILKLLGATLPAGGAPSTLIPMFFQANPGSLTTTLTYAATSITFPASEGGYANYYLAAQKLVLIRPLEKLLAQYVNMGSLGDLGPSLLDTSIGVGMSGGGVLKVTGRRPITDKLYAQVETNFPAIGYFVVPDNLLSSGAGNLGLYGTGGNLEYNEGYARALSGSTTQDIMGNLTVSEGIVANGFTSNISENTGTSRPSSFAQTLVSEIPPEHVGFVKTWARNLMPHFGNYCGEGWTAGVRTDQMSTLMDMNGRYLVPPTSREDGVCKMHDEAYAAAKGNKDKIREADLAMIKALSNMGGKSIFGHAAEMAIRAKVEGERFLESPESFGRL